ncbi:MAG: TOTE conflict system archaeo-eukaryotic primase domain-containing protein, partial [Candidatus Doudnabacteria bacterium]
MLLKENYDLKAENKKLKAQLGIGDLPTDGPRVTNEESIPNKVKNRSVEEKIKLFMSLFKGRNDVYAKRWQNKEGKSGYSPVCTNEREIGICNKPKIKCADCTNKSFGVLNENVIEDHLKGNIVVGIYPMCTDDTCHFLAIDFDGEDLPAGMNSILQAGWQKDITVFREVCNKFDIQVAVERSRSGNGAHAWFFFENQISAALARKLGTLLLTYSMSKRHEIKFSSYDRLFPNQDTMPKGGFGNLIALPLQMRSRKQGNSVFIDNYFNPYPDQWAFLNSVKKLTEDKVGMLISNLLRFNRDESELGELRKDDETLQARNKPWEKIPATHLTKDEFPSKISLVKAGMIYIPKEGISQRALNVFKRLAAFKNPEFYKA